MSHTCHAVDCKKPVKPELLMCFRHWSMVPKNIQREVWAAYRSGQCDDKQPSGNWWDAAGKAIEAVARKEGKNPAQGLMMQEMPAMMTEGGE